jgi:hypothetical protein
MNTAINARIDSVSFQVCLRPGGYALDVFDFREADKAAESATDCPTVTASVATTATVSGGVMVGLG